MKTLSVIVTALILVFGTVTFADDAIQGNTFSQSFNKAKKTLMRQIYHDHRTTFYCGCDFNSEKKVFHTNGYEPKKKWKRANRLEWEHIVTAGAFG
jgi:deoxyribonuclease-1